MNTGNVFMIQFSCIKNIQAFRILFFAVYFCQIHSILKNKDQNNEAV